MTQYDTIATEYVASKMKSRSRENVEYHTFLYRLLLPALGIEDATKIDLKTVLVGQRVLDLGCGGGYYTRKLKEELGCEDIVGVDISPNMIAIGRAGEQDHPLGILYQELDVQHLVKPEKKFDLVTAFYLLNYAKTSDELEGMAHVIGEQLNDNNKAYFLSITWNVCGAENILNTDRYRKNGYLCEARTPLFDGAQVKNTHFNSDDSSFSYITYYFSPGIYEQAFRKAGFTHFEWVPIEVACNTDEYNEYIKYPPIIGISAHK